MDLKIFNGYYLFAHWVLLGILLIGVITYIIETRKAKVRLQVWPLILFLVLLLSFTGHAIKILLGYQ
ncbi:hypothetical protein A2716_04185 [candidate division WWE3 bacterium RIFCSPHIGHO2_01_FULL_40_23]|uniref:Uncharacterized protein n=1 Tax=candidate division WWE3 bacterium RIFCSPLOWO2_01_FULL_41_18 TaxID=1802625 RepID=A0A1F4VEE4_UNCKA|nr:MAG: hypothetical protein A2716_04185 [candidate division WWE3 bacterium RIFCSPHIGHO2_01_FULL_40_23]OGC55073.1 MAG: hypothetical protein A3A78_03795 [candidate division WWE3 bacterium RIFCSPLOWO2_01_FULL_41_18]